MFKLKKNRKDLNNKILSRKVNSILSDITDISRVADTDMADTDIYQLHVFN